LNAAVFVKDKTLQIDNENRGQVLKADPLEGLDLKILSIKFIMGQLGTQTKNTGNLN
jgi:hypothetical protein